MKVSEAKQITGGLSKPSKMPGFSYNLPAYKCITGVKLQAVPGSVCAGCYAMKGRYAFGNVKAAMDRRLASLTHPKWSLAMSIQINMKHKYGHEYFRWHDSGDLQSVQHLRNIFDVCLATPAVQHWMPTREAKILKEIKIEEIPSNLIIRMSSHMINQGPVKAWPWTSTVETDGQHNCPSSEQGNKCLHCRACWNKNLKNVSYGKH